MKSKSAMIRLLVRAAIEGSEHRSIQERADLFEAAALVLDGDEADEASTAACLLRNADEAQLKFRSLLSNSK